MTDKVKVFVYGTLKSGYGNNRLLRGQAFLGERTTMDACYSMTDCGFPFVFKGGGHKVKGEVYEVELGCLGSLDGLEGHPNWYVREEVQLDDGDTAWMYIMDEDYARKHKDITPNEEGLLEWMR